eukprot:Opistho-2@26754
MASQSRFASTFTLPIDPIAVDADMPATAPANMTASMADLGLGGPSLEDTLPELTNSMRRVSLPPLTISPDPEDEPVSEAIPRRLSRINRRRQSYIDLAEKAADLLQFQQPSRSSLSDGRALSLSLLPTDADWDSSDEEDPLPVRHDRPLVNYRSNSKRAPIERFRNAVKTVLGNLKLIKSLPENKFDGIADNWVEVLRRAVKHVIILNKAGMKVKKVLQNGRERVTRDSEGLAEDNKANTMVFNLNAFMAQFQLEVSPEAKKIMVRMPSERSERDLKKLHKLVSGLKCFEKYSKTVRHELCRVIRYERHETGRMVIRQGDPGRSFYFILSGSVRVNVKETDPLTGRSFTKQVDELHKGDSFGELALLKNITRQATILCKEATEFLSMDKEDFQGILRQSHSQELEEKINFLRSTELMASWPDDLVRTVSDTSQVKDFKAKMVLLRTQQPSDWIFLVRRGRCEAIKAIETRMSHKSLPPMRHSDHVSTGKGKDAAGHGHGGRRLIGRRAVALQNCATARADHPVSAEKDDQGVPARQDVCAGRLFRG